MSKSLVSRLVLVIIASVSTLTAMPAFAESVSDSENSRETNTEITLSESTSVTNLEETGAIHDDFVISETQTDSVSVETSELKLSKEKNNRVPLRCRIFPAASMQQ